MGRGAWRALGPWLNHTHLPELPKRRFHSDFVDFGGCRGVNSCRWARAGHHGLARHVHSSQPTTARLWRLWCVPPTSTWRACCTSSLVKSTSRRVTWHRACCHLAEKALALGQVAGALVGISGEAYEPLSRCAIAHQCREKCTPSRALTSKVSNLDAAPFARSVVARRCRARRRAHLSGYNARTPGGASMRARLRAGARIPEQTFAASAQSRPAHTPPARRITTSRLRTFAYATESVRRRATDAQMAAAREAADLRCAQTLQKMRLG